MAICVELASQPSLIPNPSKKQLYGLYGCTVVRIQTLERLRLCQLRGENQGVESALVDDDGGLVSSDSVANRDAIPVFCIHMSVNQHWDIAG